MAIEQRQRDARQHATEHRQVAAALDTRADERRPRPPGRITAGAKWRIATPETAAVRSAVIGPPSRIAVGSPVAASLMTTTALIAGSPSSLLVPNPATHFMPEEVVATLRIRPTQVRRHRVRERAVRARMDADLGRQLGIGDQSGHRLLGQLQAFIDIGHRREHVRGGEVADRQGIGRQGP